MTHHYDTNDVTILHRLLLFTSNGTLNNRIRAKSTHVVKTYELDVAGNIDAAVRKVNLCELERTLMGGAPPLDGVRKFPISVLSLEVSHSALWNLC